MSAIESDGGWVERSVLTLKSSRSVLWKLKDVMDLLAG